MPQRAALAARLARCLVEFFFFAKVGILRNTSPQPCENANRAVVERLVVARAQRLGAIRGPEGSSAEPARRHQPRGRFRGEERGAVSAGSEARRARAGGARSARRAAAKQSSDGTSGVGPLLTHAQAATPLLLTGGISHAPRRYGVLSRVPAHSVAPPAGYVTMFTGQNDQ